jgi:hypothetical protein
MRTLIAIPILLTLAGLISSSRLAADETKGEDAAAGKLVGTWKLVSAKYGGRESDLPNLLTTLKHMTPAQYMWVSYDKDGKVIRTAGGPYTFKGETMESTPEYGMSADFEVIRGKRQSYTVKVEGRRLFQSGTLSNGMTLEEVWERVETK